MARELLLLPGPGGIFEIRVEDTLLWSRKDQGGFPEIKELKRLVRDHSVGGTSTKSIEIDCNRAAQRLTPPAHSFPLAVNVTDDR
jgi:predicted Rdx family selenoprotein